MGQEAAAAAAGSESCASIESSSNIIIPCRHMMHSRELRRALGSRDVPSSRLP